MTLQYLFSTYLMLLNRDKGTLHLKKKKIPIDLDPNNFLGLSTNGILGEIYRGELYDKDCMDDFWLEFQRLLKTENIMNLSKYLGILAKEIISARWSKLPTEIHLCGVEVLDVKLRLLYIYGLCLIASLISTALNL